MPRKTRAAFRTTVLLLALVLALSLAACGGGNGEPAEEEGSGNIQKIRVGTLPTEDALPLWVAEERGLFREAGLDVEIITFPAAAERDIAFQGGRIDAFMGDMIAAAALESAGTDVRLATVMLGADTQPKGGAESIVPGKEQGRFGILASPKGGPSSMSAAARAGIGTSSNTIQEYVVDGLMRESKVATSTVKKVEVKKVPERFALLMAGKLPAAALPEPLLSLGQKQGGKLLADDTKGDENLSQTVLVVNSKYEADETGRQAVDSLLDVWDEAVKIINENPNEWRETLVEKARLPEPLKTTYEVQVYPNAQLPAEEEVNAVLEWMRIKELLKNDVTFEDLTER